MQNLCHSSSPPNRKGTDLNNHTLGCQACSKTREYTQTEDHLQSTICLHKFG